MLSQADTGTDILHIPRSVWAEVTDHCHHQLPREACGVLVGKGNRVCRAIPLPNVSPSPARAYLADPEHLYRVLLELEDRSAELLAVYHSHPGGPATLSSTDLEQAFWPGVVHVVVSLAGESPCAAGFRVQGRGRDAQVVEVCLALCQ